MLNLTRLHLGIAHESQFQGLGISTHDKTIPGTGLHYNIQIHLPATKDIEVYNAIFKSLKEHLFE